MPDAKGSTTSISAKIDGVLFRTAGTIITELGWKAAWGNLEEAPESKKDSEDDDGDTNRVLPPVTDGQPAVANQVDVLSKTTRPPPHFTEGTLLKARSEEHTSAIQSLMRISYAVFCLKKKKQQQNKKKKQQLM